MKKKSRTGQKHSSQGKTAVALFESLETRTFLSVTAASIVPHLARETAMVGGAARAARGTGLAGEYFSDASLQTPIATTPASGVNFHWAYGRPLNVIPAGVYSAKFVGSIVAPRTGAYKFYVGADQSVALSINGVSVLTGSAGGASAPVTLTAGVQTSIELDYLHTQPTTAPAHLRLYWSGSGFTPHIVPRSALFPASISLPSEPLVGSFYSGTNFNKLQMVEADSTIHFKETDAVPDIRFPQGSPFSVRWTGTFTPTVTGVYKLLTNTDDGVRLYIDGKLLINRWYDQVGSDTHVAKITLTAGQSYSLRMDYYANSELPSTADLRWIVPGTSHAALLPFSLPPAAQQAPAAPTGLAATGVSASQINLQWNAVEGETSYKVLRLGSDGLSYSQIGTTTTATTFSDTGLSAGSAYTYEIIAVNSAGNSPATAPASASTQTQSGAPGMPVITSAIPTGTTAAITWGAVSSATSYLLERSSDGVSGWTSVGTTAATTLTDTALTNATTYFYRVTASNGAGAGSPSAAVSVLTLPAAPTVTAVTATPTEIDLNWNDVTGETGFVVEQSLDGTTFTPVNSFNGNLSNPFRTVGTGVTSLQVGGLNSSTKYYFEVLAENNSGGSASNVASATTSVPNPPLSPITEMYGLTTGGAVYAINTSNGAVTKLGTLSFGTNAGARDPVSGNVYYVSTGQTSVEIATWNPFNSVNTVVNANVPVGNPVAQAAFRDDGQLFITTDMGQLFAVDSITGDATFEGTFTVNGSTLLTGNGDIAFAPNKTLYIESNSEIYTATAAAVNGANGGASKIAVTQVGATHTTNLQINFGQSGVLFGTNSAGQLYTINTTTGAATAVGSPSGVAMGDLANTTLYGDLAVNQSSSTFARGGTGTYTINVVNNGPDSTVGPTTVVDVLPAGVSPLSISNNGWTASLSGQTLTLTYVPNLPAGTAAPAITLKVGIGTSASNSVSNTVTASTTEFETSLTNNVSTISTAVTG